MREWRFSDCDSLAENANNEKIWNNVMDHFPHPYTKQDAFDYISMVHAMPVPPMRFAIEVDGKAVGSIGFGSEGDIERVTAEIGYWLGEPYWGRGIMPRVVAAVTRYAFETFGYQKLYALVFDYNPGSMRVLEKAGYQLEAVLHKAGREKWEGDRLLLLQYPERELIKKAVSLQDAAFFNFMFTS